MGWGYRDDAWAQTMHIKCWVYRKLTRESDGSLSKGTEELQEEFLKEN